MKLLKNFALSLATLILILAVGGFILPSHTEVYRSIEIQRETSRVYNVLDNYKEFTLWSPWASKDPDTKYTYSGAVKGVGAKMSWQSDSQDVGSGSQEITEVVPNKLINIKLRFDGQGEADAMYMLESKEGHTLLTWGFRADHGYNPISRYFGLMFDSMIGPDYEQGLSNLKNLLEKQQ